ncbi:RING-type domain-containing protein [Aphis craccivora]|uniref:RING-type domain-containing protein n=1 Tax=Aphis craccivora TaxID=307492 RepID=A0A6G0Y2H2_APHCR|nr:RING-type domain-containing protein [Aphis craccivora]
MHLIGPNADILSVNGVIWRTNNKLEVSHQHLRMHIAYGQCTSTRTMGVFNRIILHIGTLWNNKNKTTKQP